MKKKKEKRLSILLFLVSAIKSLVFQASKIGALKSPLNISSSLCIEFVTKSCHCFLHNASQICLSSSFLRLTSRRLTSGQLQLLSV